MSIAAIITLLANEHPSHIEDKKFAPRNIAPSVSEDLSKIILALAIDEILGFNMGIQFFFVAQTKSRYILYYISKPVQEEIASL